MVVDLDSTDPDGDDVTLEADGIPDGASFDVMTGKFTWETPAAGEYSVTLTARDRKAAAEKTTESTEPSTEESVNKLTITNLTIGKASGTAQVGDDISISVQSTGGTEIIQYRFSVKNSSSAIIRNYTTSTSAKWKPQKEL